MKSLTISKVILFISKAKICKLVVAERRNWQRKKLHSFRVSQWVFSLLPFRKGPSLHTWDYYCLLFHFMNWLALLALNVDVICLLPYSVYSEAWICKNERMGFCVKMLRLLTRRPPPGQNDSDKNFCTEQTATQNSTPFFHNLVFFTEY